MWKSCEEYFGLLWHYAWIFIMCVILAIVGAGYDFSQSTGLTLFTVSHLWGRGLWIIALIGLFLIAPFWAFHRVRLQRDNALGLLKSRPSLWIRTKGISSLSNPLNLASGEYKRVAWVFGVNIANTSPTESLGIRTIILEIPFSAKQPKILLPNTGELESDFSNPPCGDIADTFLLLPSEPKAGTLVFLEELEPGHIGEAESWRNAKIVITDTLDNIHIFPTGRVHDYTQYAPPESTA